MAVSAASMVKRTSDDAETWDFSCPVFTDSLCGFQSTGWPTKKVAVARAEEHLTEHKEGTRMSSLDEFRKAQGLNDDGTLPDGAVRLGDL